MRNMSFMLTTEQVRNRTKTVTRRKGWLNLKAGDRLMACKKCMGLKPGEKIEKLGEIVVVDVRREPLDTMIRKPEYGYEECKKEGFPNETPSGFVLMFCSEMNHSPEDNVTRIQYDYL